MSTYLFLTDLCKESWDYGAMRERYQIQFD